MVLEEVEVVGLVVLGVDAVDLGLSEVWIATADEELVVERVLVDVSSPAVTVVPSELEEEEEEEGVLDEAVTEVEDEEVVAAVDFSEVCMAMTEVSESVSVLLELVECDVVVEDVCTTTDVEV